MIISASYRTDIPTFYGDWFMNRLRAGYCKTRNPYNRSVQRISLLPEDVEGFVFWTKNIGPFMKHLAEIRGRGFPFVVQHTINGYPRALEQMVVDSSKSIEHVRRLADDFGTSVCVWRYDTIVHSSATPRDFHIKSFARIAKGLEGATDEVVISFAHFYRKTKRNMRQGSEEHGYSYSDPSNEWKLGLLEELTQIADSHGIRLTICSQPQYLVPGSAEARCVDADRLKKLGCRLGKVRLKGNRKECGCYESRDIGEYDTCPHGCVYCYAVSNREVALRRFQQHDPESEFLFPPASTGTDVERTLTTIPLSVLDPIEGSDTR
jgi:hypothetical protein